MSHIMAMSRGSTLVASHSETLQNDVDPLNSAQDHGDAQSFVGVGGTIVSTRIYATKVGTPTGNVVSSLYAITGTPGTSAKPTGAALATSDAVVATTLSTSFSLVDFTFSGANQFLMVNGTNYCISIEYSGGDASNRIVTGYDNNASLPGTNVSVQFSNGTWQGGTGGSLCYYLYMR